MKEQKIVIEIGHDGSITADADGFSGDACLRDINRLLDGLGGQKATVERKPDASKGRVSRARAQRLEKKR
jgi:hypothetical protein